MERVYHPDRISSPKKKYKGKWVDISDDIIMIYEGWWHKNGSVNLLTPDDISDMGEQAAYYECFCRVKNY